MKLLKTKNYDHIRLGDFVKTGSGSTTFIPQLTFTPNYKGIGNEFNDKYLVIENFRFKHEIEKIFRISRNVENNEVVETKDVPVHSPEGQALTEMLTSLFQSKTESDWGAYHFLLDVDLRDISNIKDQLKIKELLKQLRD